MAFASCMAESPTMLVIVVAVVLTITPTATCRQLLAINGGVGSEVADQCVHGCVGEMLAYRASAGCAAVTAGVSSRQMMVMSQRRLTGPCGNGCENEYLGCIDIC